MRFPALRWHRGYTLAIRYIYMVIAHREHTQRGARHVSCVIALSPYSTDTIMHSKLIMPCVPQVWVAQHHLEYHTFTLAIVADFVLK